MSDVAAARGRRGGLLRGHGHDRGRGHRLRHSRGVEGAGRVGHVAKGVSYGLIAVLALQVALGERRRPGDREGVLRTIAAKPFGTAVLVVLAVGFFAYAFWQFVRTALDGGDRGGSGGGSGSGSRGGDARSLAQRLRHGGVGVLYTASGVAALSLARGSHAGSNGNERAETARVLDWPMGRWLVGVVGLGFLGYGLHNLYQATTHRFRDDLREGEMGGAVPWAIGLGVFGHAARGVVFALVGFFLTKAAIQYDPREAVGIDGALAKLAAEAYGTWLLAAVALGLLAYGLFCLVQARYRRL